MHRSMPHQNHLYLRYQMIFFCAVILFSGLILTSLGIWIQYGTLIQVMGSFSTQLLTSSYICIGVGVALFLVGVIGCCGAWTQNRWLILVYFLIVSMMFIGQIVGTTVVILYKDVVVSMIRVAGKDSLLNAYRGPAATDPISRVWNSFMIKYKCCGLENSIQDFSSSIFVANTGLLYPKTCCVDMKSPACDGLDTTPSLIYQESCMRKLIEVTEDKSLVIIIVAAVVCFMEFASLIVSMVLFVRLGAVLR